MFDINDFDETLPGPWEWDVKRLAVSMLIAARDNGFRAKDQERIVLETVGRVPHGDARSSPAWSNLDGVVRAPRHRDRARGARGASSSRRRSSGPRRTLAKARTRDSMSAFSKLTQVVDGEVRIVDESPLIVPIDELATGDERDAAARRAARAAARSTATRSSSTGACCSSSSELDRLRAQGRRRRQRRHAGLDRAAARPRRPGPAVPADEGGRGVGARGVPRPERVHATTASASSTGQRLMQADERHLPRLAARRRPGSTASARDFYGRQLKDWKGSAEIEQMVPEGMAIYGGLCGWTLARAHARSGDRDRDRLLPRQRRQLRPRDPRASRRRTPTRTSATTRRCRPPSSSGRITAQTGL